NGSSLQNTRARWLFSAAERVRPSKRERVRRGAFRRGPFRSLARPLAAAVRRADLRGGADVRSSGEADRGRDFAPWCIATGQKGRAKNRTDPRCAKAGGRHPERPLPKWKPAGECAGRARRRGANGGRKAVQKRSRLFEGGATRAS